MVIKNYNKPLISLNTNRFFGEKFELIFKMFDYFLISMVLGTLKDTLETLQKIRVNIRY